MDDGLARVRVDFGGLCLSQASDVAGELDDGQLHAVAQAQKRNFVFAGVLDGVDFAFDPAAAPTDGDDDPLSGVKGGECSRFTFFQIFGFDEIEVELDAGGGLGVGERF